MIGTTTSDGIGPGHGHHVIPEGQAPRRSLLLPYLALVVVTVGLALIPPHRDHGLILVGAAAACFAVTVASFALMPWHRFHSRWTIAPMVLICAAVVMLRHSSENGGVGYLSLLMVPVAWQAAYGRRQELSVAVGLVFLSLALPIVVIGGDPYPAIQWRGAVVYTSVVAMIGALLHDLTKTSHLLLRRIESVASTDRLTGLHNRWCFDECLNEAVEQADLDGGGLALAIIDLDHFKAYNDAYGHPAGDDLLVEMARRWTAGLRRQDTIARWGGEEFAVLLPDTDTDSALEVISRLLAGDHHSDSSPPPITASAGVASLAESGDSATLLAMADRRLYQAKAEGRARVCGDSRSVVVGQARTAVGFTPSTGSAGGGSEAIDAAPGKADGVGS